ncbi:MAG: phosphoribosyltransferase family protein [Gammaproteobacteria bacterium]|nr:phosphoribosyltransferase family protein [Gammaproteobacteria bacterium]
MRASKRRSTLFKPAEVYNTQTRLAGFVWTGRCWLCDATSEPCGLCSSCAADLPRRNTVVLAQNIAYIDETFVPFHYAFPWDRLIQSAKFHRDLAAMRTLACVTCNEVSNYLPRVGRIVPIPLSALRYTGRGFNQAVELARPLMALVDIPLSADRVQRDRSGPPQSSLPAAARTANVRGAFTVVRPVRGETILLVDDVVTTGATLAAVASVLKRGGAARIYAMAAAAAHPLR